MLSLGEFKFEVSAAAYSRLDRLGVYRWEEQARIGRLPANQFVGPGLQTIDLDGTIYATFTGSIDQVAKMRAIAGQGAPLMIVDGVGRTWGRWVILEARETGTFFFDDGVPKRIEFALRLAQYGEDGGEDEPGRGGDDATGEYEADLEGDPAGESEIDGGAGFDDQPTDAAFDPDREFSGESIDPDNPGDLVSDADLAGDGLDVFAAGDGIIEPDGFNDSFAAGADVEDDFVFGAVAGLRENLLDVADFAFAVSAGVSEIFGPSGRGGTLIRATGGRGDIFRGR